MNVISNEIKNYIYKKRSEDIGKVDKLKLLKYMIMDKKLNRNRTLGEEMVANFNKQKDFLHIKEITAAANTELLANQPVKTFWHFLVRSVSIAALDKAQYGKVIGVLLKNIRTK